MKRMIKKITAMTLCMSFLLAPVNTQASQYTKTYKNTKEAVTDIVDLIETYYMGGKTDEATLYDYAVYGMTLSLDGYSEYMSLAEVESFYSSLDNSKLIYGITFLTNSDGYIFASEVAENSVAAKQGIVVGDIFLKINNENVSGYSLWEVMTALDKTGNYCTLEVKRGDQVFTKSLQKQETSTPSIRVLTVKDAFKNNPLSDDLVNSLTNVRYLKMDFVGEGSANELKGIIQALKTQGVTEIILDLRGNLGGYLDEALEICKQIVPKGTIVTRINKQGSAIIKSDLETAPFSKIIVLTNNNTASAAELIASALQDSGSVVVGSKSYGKGVGQGLFEFTGAGYMRLTVEEYLRRNGSKINHVGITPNVLIENPDYISEKAETLAADILAVKKILVFCGYNVSSVDGLYDEATKTEILKFKEKHGLVANTDLNVVTKFALNQMLWDTTLEKDIVLEKACKLLRP